MKNRRISAPAAVAALLVISAASLSAQAKVINVKLNYAAPGDGLPKPNFSPKGTQISLTPLKDGTTLPEGAILPAKEGMIKVGPGKTSWIPVLLTASADHPQDLTLLFIDRNRNGNFTDDGPAKVAVPALNAKTKAVWSSVNGIELIVPYGPGKKMQPYLVNFWSVREDSAGTPDVVRYSVSSWRYGTVTVNGITALVAAMDGDNNAMFDKDDMWSVLPASAENAEKAVLSINEARGTNRLMFLNDGTKDIPLQFRSFSPDGGSIAFTVVHQPITKVADRAPDDLVREERPRPRTDKPVAWGNDLPAALAQAKKDGRKVLIDFEATWCGPCHTMDQWVWNDVDVAQQINAGYVGVKVDADLQKALVKRLKIVGYPTMMLMDADGNVVKRITEYQSSKQMLEFLSSK